MTVFGRDASAFGSRSSRQLLLFLVACVAVAAWVPQLSHARTFYVDFASGSDQFDGEDLHRPWKHAPGDAKAEGKVVGATPRGGDIIQFKGGVEYRGAFTLPANGAPDRPLRLLGSGWGSDRAIISGYDCYELPIVSCLHNDVCPNGFRTSEFVTIALPIAVTYQNKIKVDGKELTIAQSSALRDVAGTMEDGKTYFQMPRSHFDQDGDLISVTTHELHDILNDDPGYDVTGFVWSSATNLIHFPQEASYDSTLHKLNLKLPGVPISNTRDTGLAIANHPRLIVREGQYATINGGRALLMRGHVKSVATVEISQRGFGISIAGKSNIDVEGFTFQGIVGGRLGVEGGTAIFSYSATTNIRIAHNKIVDTASFSRQAALSLPFANSLVIEDNIIADHAMGRGITVYKSKDVKVVNNSLSHMTFTGIWTVGSQNVQIRNNTLRDINGVHGNAISVYLGNNDVEIANNTIVGSVRPITFTGNTSSVPNNLKIDRNLIISQGDGRLVAIQSWAGRMNGVAIFANVLLAERGVGVELRPGESSVFIGNNIIDGINEGGIAADQLTVSGNIFTQPAGRYVGVDDNSINFDLRDKVLGLFSSRGTKAVCGQVQKLLAKPVLGLKWENHGGAVGIGADAICAGVN